VASFADWRRGAASAFAFFTLYFLYVWLRVEPSLLWYTKGPPFFLSSSFWQAFPGRPGGVLDYVAALLAQSDHFNWLGALVFTGIGALIFTAGRRICALAGFTPSWVLPVLPSLGLLLELEQYDTAAWNMALGLLLSLAAALACLMGLRRPFWFQMTSCWVANLAITWIAGFWPCLSFLAVVGLVQAWRWRGVARVGACLLPGTLFPLWIAWSMGERRGDFLNPWGAGIPLVVSAVLFSLLPAILAGRIILPRAADPAPATAPVSGRGKRSGAPARNPARPGHGWRQAFPIAICLAGCVLVGLAHDGQRKLGAQIEYSSGHGDSARALLLARQLAGVSPAMQIRLQYALWKQGQLLDDLFSFQGRHYRELFPGLEVGPQVGRPQVEPLLELGLVNDAEHYAHEALEIEGDRPDLLEQLARINVLKGRPEAARVFLNVLQEIPFEGSRSRGWLDRMDRDPTLAEDSGLAAIRAVMLTNDLGHTRLMTEPLLRHLLRVNPRNRMAFEYLSAQYLLNLDLDRLMELVPRLADLNYSRIPRHFEEAMLLCERQKHITFELPGLKIRPETVDRFQRFAAAARGGEAADPAGGAALARDFGDTYWYFYLGQKKGEQARQ
jgi:hypothetical protein